MLGEAVEDKLDTTTNTANGALQKSGGTMTGDITLSGDVEFSDMHGKMIASGDFSSTNVTALIDKVRYTNGVMGSVCFTSPQSISGLTVGASWYNFIYIPHRSGGSHGWGNGDNQNWGSLLLFPMTFDGLSIVVRFANGSIGSAKTLT